MTVPIFFIYAEDCSECRETLRIIENAIIISKIPCKISKFLYNSRAAIKIAVANDIDDLPGVVIGAATKSFSGNKYSEADIVKFIKKAANVNTKKDR